ncbi:MAG: EAL domain-containing protein [Cyanobacteria bacterium P01_F01_bin.150]
MPKRISALLVEDNLSDARLFEELISSSDVLVPSLHHTTGMNDTLTVLKANKFDVILLDLSLPDGQGLGLVKLVQKFAPQVPIIVLTGNANSSLAVQAIQYGVQDYWLKSEALSPIRLAKHGYIDVANSLIKRLEYAIERAEMSKKLALSEERYELAVQGSNDGIWDWDLRTNRIYYSPRWRAQLGLSYEDMGDRPEDWLTRIHPQDRGYVEQLIQKHLTYGSNQLQCEYRILHANGSYRWVLTRGMALWNDDGIAYRMAGSQTDTTSRKCLEKALHQEKELAQITIHSIGDAVITTDDQGQIKDFNPVAERLTGWTAQEAKKRSITDICTIVDGETGETLINPVLQALSEGKPVSLSNHPTLISKTGDKIAIGDSAAPIRSEDGAIVGSVLVFHDVTEERGRAQQLAWQASHDPLTKLFNRTKFHQVVDDAIALARTQNIHHVLCYMDLDHFKIVNDTCGHAAGDELLQQVTNLWRNKVRKSDALARLGGDEFGLLIYNCHLSRAIELANQFCNLVQSYRFVYGDKVFSIGVSIGIIPISPESGNTEQVMQLADATCYSAKNKGRNRVQVYHPDEEYITQQSSDSHWFSRITQALDHERFHLYHQTIADANFNSDNVEISEILIRLPNPQNNTVTLPMAFIPSAERYGLMPKIDRWVIQNSLRYLSKLSSVPNKIYSINLSGLTISDDTFIDFLKNQFQSFPIEPQKVCFEITETVAIANLQKAATFIQEMKSLGCAFALDDFGSGMSSFSYLKHLPVDYLKIDGSLVKDAAIDKVSQTILQSINQIGHSMGLKTIAEYVENKAILEKVRELGIDYVQGFAIDHPQRLVT